MTIDIRDGAAFFERVRLAFKSVIAGLDRAIETVILGMITPGDVHHVMFEGDPGVGKTLLAAAAARIVNAPDQRMQGNADLVPESFTGYWKYLDDIASKKILKPGMLTLKSWQILRERFENDLETLLRAADFTKLPQIEELVRLFPVVFLYDEANRTNPWAQGALMETLQEYKVTVGGISIPMNPATLFIFTRNKLERGQTYPLPEALSSRLAYEDELLPPTEQEAEELLSMDQKLIYQKRALSYIEPVLTVDELLEVRDYIANEVKVSKAMDRYIIQLVSGCLNQSYLRETLGVRWVPLPSGEALDLSGERIMRTDYSGRTAPGRVLLTMKQIAKAASYIHGSNYARPEHLKAVFHRAIMHHIFVDVSAERRLVGVKGSTMARAIADAVIQTVDQPKVR
jgi:MoxR-like ATPase